MKLAKQFLASSLALCAALLVSCAQVGLQSAARPDHVSHVVLVWLKNKGSAADRAKVIETTKMFRDQIPGIIAMSVGEPLPSARAVVDSSFDVGLVMRFESKEAMDAYEKHPVHTKAVKEILAPLASKIVVHDWTVK